MHLVGYYPYCNVVQLHVVQPNVAQVHSMCHVTVSMCYVTVTSVVYIILVVCGIMFYVCISFGVKIVFSFSVVHVH